MMALVRLALRRPLSVAVMAVLMLVLGVLLFALMNVDIFPAIDIPVVMVVWNYPGLSTVDVERRTVTRHPDALDPATRTMLVEVDLPNRDGSLYPGMYATVHIDVHLRANALMAPDDALIFHQDRVFLPLVRQDHLYLQQVRLGHDDGINVEVIGPLHNGDLVAMNVGQSARDGEPVQPVTADGAAASEQ
jgi:hypothetical protein